MFPVSSHRTLTATVVLLCCFLLSITGAWAQSAHAKAMPPQQATSTLQELQHRLNVQHAATQSGNGDAVIAATKKVIALALAEVAKADLQKGEWQKAAELYQKSILLEDALVSHRDLAVAQQHLARHSPRPLLSVVQGKRIKVREKQLWGVLSQSYNDWGIAQAQQGEFASALDSFHQAEQWDASTPGLMRNIGLAAFRVEDFAESARVFNISLASGPSDTQARLMLAMSLYSTGNYADAAKAFDLVPNDAKKDSRTAYAWAYSLAHTNQQKQANAIADEVTATELPADTLNLVCQIYIATENYEHAVTCFQKVYKEDSSIKRAHYEAGAALIHLDRPTEAIPELRQELTLSPDDPDVQYYLAYALLQTSHKDEAVTLLRSVIAAVPTQAQAQYQLGKVLLEDGKTDEAIQHLEVAAKYAPTAAYIHYQLQSAYRKAGRTADAKRELKVYSEIKAHQREMTPGHPM